MNSESLSSHLKNQHRRGTPLFTVETTATPTTADEKKEETTTPEQPVKEESKAAETPVAEKKSFFAKMCGCFGGSAPAADTDTKSAPDKKVADSEDVEKEEVAEEKPAAPETASA